MNTKQVIVIRRDLNMRRGKEIAQGGHAACGWLADKVRLLHTTNHFYAAVGAAAVGSLTLGATLHMGGWWIILGIIALIVAGRAAGSWIRSITDLTPEQKDWLDGKFTKICLQVPGEVELGEIYGKAKDAGLNVVMIEDSGVTEFNGEPTLTCLAIGPHESEKIDPITGDLKIY